MILRDHEDKVPYAALTAAGDRRPCRACVSIAKNERPSKGRIPLDRTIGTPPSRRIRLKGGTMGSVGKPRNARL